MARTTIIRVRASKKEFEAIKNSAATRGFSSVSAFLRSFAVERDFWIERKVQSTNEIVKEILKEVKKEN